MSCIYFIHQIDSKPLKHDTGISSTLTNIINKMKISNRYITTKQNKNV